MGEIMDAERTLSVLIDRITDMLEETVEAGQSLPDDYHMGMRAALVACLEIVQDCWEKAKTRGLDWDIEENFPVR